MSFANAIQSFFKNFANFKGRARRSEFWFAFLFVGLVGALISFVFPGQVMDLGGGVQTVVPSMVSSLWSLAVLIPGLAVVWRRLHDVNLSGGYYFMALIPIVGAILVLIKFCTEGTPGPNRFGDPVK